MLDLRWLAPLPVDDLLRGGAATGAVLVVDETRRSGGVSEGGGHRPRRRRLHAAGSPGSTSADSFVPLGPAADAVLLQEDEILAAAHRLLRR